MTEAADRAVPPPVTHPPGRAWPIGLALLVAAGDFAFAWAGYTYAIRPAGVAIWPASGFVLAVLLLVERRYWPVALAGAIAGNFLADVQHGVAVGRALAGGGANGLEALVAASLLVYLLDRPITLATLREVLTLIIGAVVLSNAATALVGALVITAGGAPYWRSWFVWWTGDGMGMLIVAPAMLTSAALLRSNRRLPARVAIEAVLTVFATALTAHLALSRTGMSNGVLGSYPYLPFPLLLWAAVRLGPWGAAMAMLALSAATDWNVSRAVGPFGSASGSLLDQVLQIYSYLGLASLSSLIPASILSERQRAEEQLRESESRFRQMAEYIEEAFFVVDLATGRTLYASPTWAEIWGRPMVEAYHPSIWFETIHPEDRAAVAATRDAVAQGLPGTSVFRIQRPDGSTRWIRSRVFPVRDDAGEPYRLVGVSEDITTLRQAEQRLAQAQKMEAVGQLAGGIAHDFNNLLTVILSYSGILLEDLPPDDDRRADIGAIRRAGESAQQLTRQLLVFSRKQILQPKVVSLHGVVEGVGAMLTRLIGEHIDLRLDLDPRTGAIKADPGNVEQVIVNLAVNARDAMPDGGTLSITATNVDLADATAGEDPPCPPGRYVMLTVSDNGLGMTDEVKARAFEPFFTTKGPHQGTGLGLATVYGIVRQSDGYIAIRSQPGRGTSFTVYFPRVDAPVATSSGVTASAGSPTGTETILVVEDEPAVRAIVQQVLTRLGYRVLEAGDGESALALVNAHEGPIDLLLTDMVMPRMNGRVLAGEFARLRPAARILFASGYTDDPAMRHGVLAAEMQYLQKPFTPDALARKVREVLDA